MATSDKPPMWVTASFTIEGPADEILREVQKLRGGRKSAQLHVELPSRQSRGMFPEGHTIPIIKDGQTEAAKQKLFQLHRQAFVTSEEDQRLETLIDEFGRLTK